MVEVSSVVSEDGLEFIMDMFDKENEVLCDVCDAYAERDDIQEVSNLDLGDEEYSEVASEGNTYF